MAADNNRDHDSTVVARSQFTSHLNHNASGILYGAVLAAAATAVVSAQRTESRFVALSIVLMLSVYSLAHLYTQVLAARMSHPDASLLHRVRSEAVHEAAVLEGGLPVLLCFAVLRVSGVSVSDSAQAASWFTVVFLAYIGYRVGRSLQATGIRLVLEVVGAAAIGLLMIVLKTQLH